jgi:DNA-binding IclR family transcriptional regulator
MRIQSIDRALQILSLFSYSHPRIGVVELSRALGLAKGTVHNIVATLESGGFLEKDKETRKYVLGRKLFSLGAVMAGTLEINQKGEGPAHRLSVRTGLTCRIAIWDEDAALVTFDVTPRDVPILAQRIGPRVLAYCSALGRALLAYLPLSEQDAYLAKTRLIAFTPKTIVDADKLRMELETTRQRGFAINEEQIILGRASVAFPVFRSGRRIAGAISITGNVEQVLRTDLEGFTQALSSTAAEISGHMGYYPASMDRPEALPGSSLPGWSP